MSERHSRRDRDRHQRQHRDDPETKSHHHHHDDKSRSKSGTSSASSSHKRRRSTDKYDSKHQGSRTKSRSRSRDRRRSSESERGHRRHHRDKSGSRSPRRKHGDDAYRSSRDRKSRGQRRSHSRSASRERERLRQQKKQEMKLKFLQNYEEKMAAVPMNPAPASKLVEQVQQRKLLFSKKVDEPSSRKPLASTSMWKQATFSEDADGKVSTKFKRLMGLKDDDSGVSKEPDVDKKQKEYFAELEKQYEVARMKTHTQRGLGLGFGSTTSP